MRYRVEGPFLREGLVDHPLFLMVVRGMDRKVNGRRLKRDPAFYLVSAVQIDDRWILPLPEVELLAWAWQRWELEVAHRELKSGFGLGEKQCWNPRSAVTSVQWSAWVYALLLLAGCATTPKQQPIALTRMKAPTSTLSLGRTVKFSGEVWQVRGHSRTHRGQTGSGRL